MEEAVETKELKEQMDEMMEERKAGWTLYLSFSTALLAVIAAIASLRSGALSNDALLLKNEAILYQAKASDQWAYYQAKGIKATIYAAQPTASKYVSEIKRYKDEQEEVKKSATEFEEKVKEKDEDATRHLEGHHKFAIAVTLFQIAIALSAIAVLVRRKALWILGLAVSGLGLYFFIGGFRF